LVYLRYATTGAHGHLRIAAPPVLTAEHAKAPST
jgi:hypothetical protein